MFPLALGVVTVLDCEAKIKRLKYETSQSLY